MADAFQFAATYPAYGHLKVSFDSDLGELERVSQLRRRRWVVGEVGIGGIKADAPYRCENGRLVEVDR